MKLMSDYYLRVTNCKTGNTEMWKVKANTEDEAIENIETKFENKYVKIFLKQQLLKVETDYNDS
jgi:hypothetical protein